VPPSKPPSEREAFPVRQVADVPPRPPGEQWLIEFLWSLEAVGLLAAPPKVGKTWLAIEMALAVATGRAALGCFAVRATGPVLFYGAEDDQAALRARFEAVAVSRGVELGGAPIYFLDVGQLRLDRADHVMKLRATIATLKPKLVLLDPFVRMVAVDENSSQEVSAVLGSLRAIQRDLHVAVLVVHHMRKASASYLGNQVRGSGDFAAWYDSALYLTRAGDGAILTPSHRGAPDPPPVRLRLVLEPAPHLEVCADGTPAVGTAGAGLEPLEAEVLDALRAGGRPCSTESLRQLLRKRKEDVLRALHALRVAGLVLNGGRGWERVGGA